MLSIKSFKQTLTKHSIEHNIYRGYFLLLILIFYTTNQLHFPQSLGIKGLNIFNIFFLIVFFLSKKYQKTKTPLSTLFILFWVVCFLGILIAAASSTSANIMSDLTYFKSIIFYMSGFFLGYRYARDDKLIQGIVVMVLVVAAVAGLEAVREAIDYGIGDYKENHRVAGPFGSDFYSSNRAGVFYSMYVPLFLNLALNLKCSKKNRLLLYAGFCLMLVSVFFTYSRQSYIISILSIILVTAKKSKILFIILLLSLPFYESWAPDSALQRIDGTNTVDESTGEKKLDESTGSRFIIWGAAFEMFSDNPLGVGLNQFQHRIEPYLGYPKDAHNHYVLTLAELGFQGIFFFLLLILSILVLAFKSYTSSNTNFRESLTAGIFTMTIAMMIGNVYGSPFYMGEVMFSYWVLLGCTAQIYVSNQNKSI